jgi:regulatory protein
MAGRITALRFQKRDDQRVNVYLDGVYAFALPAHVAAKLKIGQELADQDITTLKGVDEADKAYHSALRFLAYRARSVAEVQRYLEAKETPAGVVESTIHRLLAAGYLDDQAFARSWVADRERFKPRAPAALRQELRAKGIQEQAIAQALDSLDSETSARRAGSEYARRLDTLDRRSFRHKLGGYLLRRGFPHEVVWPVVDQLWRDKHGEQDNRDDPDDDIEI